MKYRGYTIEPETDLWAIKFGSKFRFYLDGERVHAAESEEEAKKMIDEIHVPRFIKWVTGQIG